MALFRSRSRRPLVSAAAASAAVVLLCAAAQAQTFDHLVCYKIRDARTFASAGVDLESIAPELGVASCTIKGRAKQICVPADEAVTSISGGSVIGDESEELALYRLCYKLKCPRIDADGQLVSDQFGSRTVGGFKAIQLCTPASPASPTSTTMAPPTTMEPSLDDDFEGSSLDPSWSVFNPSLVTIEVSGGALHLTPTASGAPGIWYQDGEGPLVYKEVTGDFDVHATLSTRDPAIPANPPPPAYRLAGILARDPASTPMSSNTVHVALGAGSNVQGTCYEYKSTDDSVSDWEATPTASPDGQVRLRRSGATVEMYWRADAMDAWTMIHSFNRPDLPATLQVGPMIYAVDAPPSIEALFHDIVFE